MIRIKGRNLTESEHIKLGAYHSLELELGRAFTLKKVFTCGDQCVVWSGGEPARVLLLRVWRWSGVGCCGLLLVAPAWHEQARLGQRDGAGAGKAALQVALP